MIVPRSLRCCATKRSGPATGSPCPRSSAPSPAVRPVPQEHDGPSLPPSLRADRAARLPAQEIHLLDRPQGRPWCRAACRAPTSSPITRRARAGGAGLVIVEVAAVHPTAIFTTHTIDATTDACIAGYRAIAAAVHGHGCRVFGQLFHPGREIIESVDGSTPVSYAPSAVPNERFHVMPRAMPRRLIDEVVAGYGARRPRGS
ncbi:MAG: hypothetical protein U1E53_21245 [Dongiaceae bacterium]